MSGNTLLFKKLIVAGGKMSKNATIPANCVEVLQDYGDSENEKWIPSDKYSLKTPKYGHSTGAVSTRWCETWKNHPFDIS